MIAHDDVDDPATPRIAHWLDEFRRTPLGAADADGWWEPWMAILARSGELAPTDDRAIIRDNRVLGLSDAVDADLHRIAVRRHARRALRRVRRPGRVEHASR